MKDDVSKAAAAMGSIKSDKKAAAARSNGAKGGRPRKDAEAQSGDATELKAYLVCAHMHPTEFTVLLDRLVDLDRASIVQKQKGNDQQGYELKKASLQTRERLIEAYKHAHDRQDKTMPTGFNNPEKL